MRKYSKSATRMKAMFTRIQRIRGQIPSKQLDCFISFMILEILAFSSRFSLLSGFPTGKGIPQAEISSFEMKKHEYYFSSIRFWNEIF